MPSSATMWCSSYLRRTRKISRYRSGCFENRLVSKLLAEPREAKCCFKSVMGWAPRATSDEVHKQASEHGGRPVAARLALAEDNVRQKLAQLWPTIGERHQQVGQRRLAIPVANPFAEAKDLFEAGVQLRVVLGEVGGREIIRFEGTHEMLGRDLARLQGIVDAFARQWIDEPGGFTDQQGALGKRRRTQKIDADRIALERSSLAGAVEQRLQGGAPNEPVERLAGGTGVAPRQEPDADIGRGSLHPEHPALAGHPDVV